MSPEYPPLSGLGRDSARRERFRISDCGLTSLVDQPETAIHNPQSVKRGGTAGVMTLVPRGTRVSVYGGLVILGVICTRIELLSEEEIHTTSAELTYEYTC